MRSFWNLTNVSSYASAVLVTIAMVLLAIQTTPADAQLAGRGTGWCTDHNGRNFRCRSRVSGNRNRTATAYNNQGVDLLRRGGQTKSLATVRQAIDYFRRAYQIQAHWIHQRNLFAGLTYYWSLMASKTSNCSRKLTYLRRAVRTMRYYPAHQKRSAGARVRALERSCGGATANQPSTRSPSTRRSAATQQQRRQKPGQIGRAGTVTGNVYTCWRGKCRKVKPGAAILFNGAVSTGNKSRLQIRFTDGTVLTVGPNTQIVFNQYYFGRGPLFNIKRGIIRWVSALTGGIEKKIRSGGVTMSIRGTDFVVRVIPSTRTLTIELFEGKVAIKPKGEQKELALSPGLWIIKWFGRRAGRRYRITRARAYRLAGDSVLARRRGYYDRVLPRARSVRRTRGRATGRVFPSSEKAQRAIVSASWPVGRGAHYRTQSGYSGKVTPITGFYTRANPPARCRQVAFVFISPSNKRSFASGRVCLLSSGAIQTLPGRITDE